MKFSLLGGATINQLAVFLPKWQAMSVIALLVNGNSSLKSFHLETSLEARHENASTYSKFKFSSIPGCVHLCVKFNYW